MSRRSAVRGKAKERVVKRAKAPRAAGRPRGLWQAGNSAVAGVIGQMEQSLGEDLSGVEIHAGPQAAALAGALGAVAFTRADHIFLGVGAPPLHSNAGRRLLAHELTHVVQQRQASAVDPLAVGEAGDGLERSADRTASLALQGQAARVPSGGSAPGVQRQAAKPSPYADKAEVERTIREFLEKDAPRNPYGDVEMAKVEPQLVRLSQAPPVPPRADKRAETAIRLMELFKNPTVPRKPGALAKKIAEILPSPFPRAELGSLHPLPVSQKETTTEKVERTLKEGPDRNAPAPLEAEPQPGPGDRSRYGTYVAGKSAFAPTEIPIPLSSIAELAKKEEKPKTFRRDEAAPRKKEDQKEAVPEIPPPQTDVKKAEDPVAAPAPAAAEGKSAQQGLGALPGFVETAIQQAQALGKTTADLVLGDSLKAQQEVVFGQVKHLLQKHKMAKGTVIAVNVFFGGKLARTVHA